MDYSPIYFDLAKKFSITMKPIGIHSVSLRYEKAAEVAMIIYPAIKKARVEFLSFCVEDNPSFLNKTFNFPKRFFGGAWRSRDIAESCCRNIQEVFDFGFLTHLVFTEFPTRKNHFAIDSAQFCNKWLPKSLIALIKMRNYSKEIVPSVPLEELFTCWYDLTVDKLVKVSWKISFLKRSSVRSYFYATFFTGISLAFEYDLSTKYEESMQRK